jgi:hypothetical protein
LIKEKSMGKIKITIKRFFRERCMASGYTGQLAKMRRKIKEHIEENYTFHKDYVPIFKITCIWKIWKKTH